MIFLLKTRILQTICKLKYADIIWIMKHLSDWILIWYREETCNCCVTTDLFILLSCNTLPAWVAAVLIRKSPKLSSKKMCAKMTNQLFYFNTRYIILHIYGPPPKNALRFCPIDEQVSSCFYLCLLII